MAEVVYQLESRPVWRAMGRGFRKRCPRCGEGKLMAGYLTVASQCNACGLDLTPQRADDAPPYFTIFIVGHIVVPLMWAWERYYAPPAALQMAVWLPVIALLSLWLLPRVKGATVGLQWAMKMHDFGESRET
ncbi:DUF983 domain-containing protein [Aestuariivirga litoralis]|uniref:DUF983 domain-containing protein n=1 Tax=Aestuariivirga litoralis TaxID=2650924 RepID=UPI0018C7FAFE|nr:DUF983 domain-containing protein [Aestuariivirga litoralis]MBG1231614.1 DUF983 domain-containing protein [Aestuariivirga litoralis]